MILALFGVTFAAPARADDAWSGSDAANNHDWSDAGNWTGGVAPTGSAGTLAFSDLGSCTTCYTADNDLTGLSAAALTFANTTPSSAYHILGNQLTLGSGGISDVGGGSTSATLNLPLTLSAAQTWRIGAAGGYNSVTLTPPSAINGAFPLSVVFPTQGSGDLWIDRDMEVGPVTVSGQGGLHIGLAPSVPNRTPGSVNGNDGGSVAVNDSATLVANPGSTTGPLSFDGGSLLLGTGPTNQQATTLQVNGAASLASARQETILLDDNGAAAGTDYSQLSAAGNIALGGQLNVEQGPSNGTCVDLSPGDVAKLVTTEGTLSGRFSNAPDGSILAMASSCQSPAPHVQIAYTANYVTATVVGATTPTSPPGQTPAPTGQPSPPTTTVPTHVSTSTPRSTSTPTGTTPTSRLRASATTTRASHVGETRARLTGTITAHGAAVTWRFAYTGRGRATQMTAPRRIAAGRTRLLRVSEAVSKLRPNVRYRVRLIVSSAAGTDNAGPSSFETADTGRLLVLDRRLSLSHRATGVLARCASGRRCTGRLTITATVRSATRSRPTTVVCAGDSFRIAAHHDSRLRERVTPTCRAVLARVAGHHIAVTLTVGTHTGQRGPRRRLTLAWPRP